MIRRGRCTGDRSPFITTPGRITHRTTEVSNKDPCVQHSSSCSTFGLCLPIVWYVPSSLTSPAAVFALSECWEAYNASKPAKETCSHCGEALAVVEGKFSGSFVKLGDGIKVHGGFMMAFQISSRAL